MEQTGSHFLVQACVPVIDHKVQDNEGSSSGGNIHL